MAEEKFLARWSQRKRAAARDAPSRATVSGEEMTREASIERDKPVEAPLATAAPNLPKIEAIDSSTDIREFLAEGVPTAVARAALRHAWASDPAIRDFVGLAENAWDFNEPDQIPGFGTVSAEDVRRLLAHAEQPGPAPVETPPSAAPGGEASPKPGAKDERTPEPEPLKDANQRAVAQLEPTEAAPSSPSVPRHGGALPK